MKTYGEWRYSSTFLDLGTMKGEKTRGFDWIGDWVGLESVEKRKKLHSWESN
jgi:hypothetical protein